jgi:hypothetical protein
MTADIADAIADLQERVARLEKRAQEEDADA